MDLPMQYWPRVATRGTAETSSKEALVVIETSCSSLATTALASFRGVFFIGRSGRVSSEPESVAAKKRPTRVHPSARRANCLRGIATVIGTWWDKAGDE